MGKDSDPKLIEKETAEVPVVDPGEPEGCSTVEDLLLLFSHCIDTYEWVHEAAASGLATALRGSFGLLLRPEYTEMWEDICADT